MLGTKYFKSEFVIVDYVVLGFVFFISIIIGIYYAYKSRKRQTTEEYLLAGRNMSLFPVSLSLIASFSSAIGMLGNPTEYYNYSLRYAWNCIAFLLCYFSCSYLFLPVFYCIGKTSIYEYLGHRFDAKVRFLASIIYIFKMILYTSVALYAPSLALNAIIGISVAVSIVVTSVICTFYTVLGGLKAVIWTDVFQTFLIYTSVIAVIIKGFVTVDAKDVWRINDEGGRLYFFDFHTSPYIRYSFWSGCVGAFFVWSGLFGINQTLVQRYLALPTLRKARMAVFFNSFGMASVFALHGVLGLLIYAYYSTCDPLSAGFIKRSDQILPYFSMEMLQAYPGLPGLFVGGVFSACLSTISSSINSIAAIILEDIVKVYIKKDLSEKQATFVTKIAVFVVGVVCLGLAFLCGHARSISQLSSSIFGLAGGPLLGTFMLGMIFPWANAKGALVGLICSSGIIFWIGLGTLYHQPPTDKLPVTTSGCDWNSSLLLEDIYFNGTVPNSIVFENFTTPKPEWSGSSLDVYRISYMWYSLISCSIAIIMGLIVSLITGLEKPSSLEAKLIYPAFYKILFFLPRSHRNKLMFGIKYKGEYGIYLYCEEVIHMEAKKTLISQKVAHPMSKKIINENNQPK